MTAREARLAAADTPSDACLGIGGEEDGRGFGHGAASTSRREMGDGDTSTQCQGTC